MVVVVVTVVVVMVMVMVMAVEPVFPGFYSCDDGCSKLAAAV